MNHPLHTYLTFELYHMIALIPDATLFKVIVNDVRAIDINMGCPKHFSLQAGMGAALLYNPENTKDILSTLTRNLGDFPVTCKIRLLDTVEETVAHCRLAAQCGVTHTHTHTHLPTCVYTYSARYVYLYMYIYILS